jgi:AAA15 family ATPase/GTPase
MLLSFSVTNFRSFRAEETLSLVASKRLSPIQGTPHGREVPGTGEHALRVASLYGANGAGKSNLVHAISLLRQLVLSGTQVGKPISYKPFRLDEESPKSPTILDVQFLADGEVFRYGVCFDASRVHEEWLDVHEETKERNIFNRTTSESGEVAVELGGGIQESASPKLSALASVGARPNQLFLTEIVNLDDPSVQGIRLRRVLDWFRSTLTIIEPSSHFASLIEMIATDNGFAEFLGRFLREAGTGIADLVVDKQQIRRSLLPLENSLDLFEKLTEADRVVLRGPHGEQMDVCKQDQDTIEIRTISALHDSATGQRTVFPLREESDGSLRLLHLLPALYRLSKEGGVFVIDELERSMHPMLARKFVEFFLKVAGGTPSQLIFTTHETTLLDLDLLRRDGIWFAEKDRGGATRLYSLADFKVRQDLRVDKGYLLGRFGAIPFLGEIDSLIEEQSAPGLRHELMPEETEAADSPSGGCTETTG